MKKAVEQNPRLKQISAYGVSKCPEVKIISFHVQASAENFLHRNNCGDGFSLNQANCEVFVGKRIRRMMKARLQLTLDVEVRSNVDSMNCWKIFQTEFFLVWIVMNLFQANFELFLTKLLSTRHRAMCSRNFSCLLDRKNLILDNFNISENFCRSAGKLLHKNLNAWLRIRVCISLQMITKFGRGFFSHWKCKLFSVCWENPDNSNCFRA